MKRYLIARRAYGKALRLKRKGLPWMKLHSRALLVMRRLSERVSK